LQAFAEAGADVLYAPGLRSAEQVLAVVRAVAPKPVNVLMSGGLNLTVEQLSDMGVKRISVGSALALAAYGEFFRAAEEIRKSGTFSFTSRSMPYVQANDLFKG
jgi:2-methylisocitrate lyase-like PEP mutase family enzyme